MSENWWEKPWYREWEIWAIVLVVVLFVMTVAFGEDTFSIGCSVESHPSDEQPLENGG